MLDAWASELAGDLANAVINVNRVGIAVTLDDPHVGISQRAVTFTATPLPGQEPPTSFINQPTLFIDL